MGPVWNFDSESSAYQHFPKNCSSGWHRDETCRLVCTTEPFNPSQTTASGAVGEPLTVPKGRGPRPVSSLEAQWSLQRDWFTQWIRMRFPQGQGPGRWSPLYPMHLECHLVHGRGSTELTNGCLNTYWAKINSRHRLMKFHIPRPK